MVAFLTLPTSLYFLNHPAPLAELGKFFTKSHFDVEESSSLGSDVLWFVSESAPSLSFFLDLSADPLVLATVVESASCATVSSAMIKTDCGSTI
jgi:hypothetical protein